MTKKKLLIFLFGLTLFSFLIRVYRLTEPPHYYFDEVYHAVTAKAYADNNKDAYDPFAKAPKEGTAYDWLHPPLAKLIQAGSIKFLGDKSIGWRLPSLIFGTAIIPLTFVLAYLLFGPAVAVFASVVIAFENLTFVMSRITMNDVFITSFSLVAFIFTVLYTKRKKILYLFLTGLFLSLAIVSKWTGFYAAFVVILYLIVNAIKSRKFDFRLLVLFVLPPLVYLGSFGQYWLMGYNTRDFVNLNKQIWWYQNRHDLEHSYGTTPLYCVPHGLVKDKTWCPWVLDARGVYFSYEEYKGENGEVKAGYIYALGNPLIFWSGIIAVSYLLGKFLEERKKEYALILLGYFIFWLPWIFTPRLLFLYHYLPAIPFMSIALGISLAAIYKTRLKYLSVLIVLIFIAAFFFFYPISSGFPIRVDAIDNYMWLSTWR